MGGAGGVAADEGEQPRLDIGVVGNLDPGPEVTARPHGFVDSGRHGVDVGGLAGHPSGGEDAASTVRYSARPFVHTTDLRLVDTRTSPPGRLADGATATIAVPGGSSASACRCRSPACPAR